MLIHLSIALLAITLAAPASVAQEKTRIYLGRRVKRSAIVLSESPAKKAFSSSRASMFNSFSCGECR